LRDKEDVMGVNIVEKIDGPVKIRNVIVSVSDKSGLESFAPAMLEVSPEIKFYSTGGTYGFLEKALGEKAGTNLVQVSAYTGQPEMQGGLVKTLDFKIYLGLLSETYNEAHRVDLERTSAAPVDMVVVNLYPFRETVARAECTAEEARSNIDIGGPCMVRASAKNFIRVASVVDPADYGAILGELKEAGGTLSLRTRFGLARKAFSHTAEYDTAIAGYLAEKDFGEVEEAYEIVRSAL